MKHEEDLEGEKGWYTNGFKCFIKNNKNKKEQRLLKQFHPEIETETVHSFAVAEKVLL